MAWTSSNNPGPLRRQTQSTPNTNTEAETEKKEETQSEPKASEKENNANGSSDGSSEEEETTQRKNQAIAEGKKPMEAKDGKHKKWEFKEMTRGRESTKGVVIGEAKRSKTITTPAKSGKRKERYAVRSPCILKSPLKKFYVDVASDDDEPKGKGKEKEADNFEDPEADSEETCKRIKKIETVMMNQMITEEAEMAQEHTQIYPT
ncbi:hypothetical protein Tco_0630266 [Tanacetum coccineum]